MFENEDIYTPEVLSRYNLVYTFLYFCFCLTEKTHVFLISLSITIRSDIGARYQLDTLLGNPLTSYRCDKARVVIEGVFFCWTKTNCSSGTSDGQDAKIQELDYFFFFKKEYTQSTWTPVAEKLIMAETENQQNGMKVITNKLNLSWQKNRCRDGPTDKCFLIMRILQ